MLLFVYGTLKRGHGNHGLLAGAKFLGADEAPGMLYVGPVCAPSDTHWVKGEVYELDGAMMRPIDRLEGHPHAYTRKTVTLRSGRVADIYYWLHPVRWSAPVESGEYV